MRRAVLLVVVAAVLALAGGMVLAESKTCATVDCVGTREADTMTGRDNAPDRIAGMEGDDQIDGGGGSDTLYGDEGNDTIHVDEFNGAAGDTVNCGPGTKDRVFFDRGLDTIHKSCGIRNPGLAVSTGGAGPYRSGIGSEQFPPRKRRPRARGPLAGSRI